MPGWRETAMTLVANGRAVATNDSMLDLRSLERWLYVAWFNFIVHYRKTTLGPAWLLVSPILFIAVLGTLYSHVNSVHSSVFVPSLTVGIVVWTLIGGFVSQSSTVFQRHRAQILQGSMQLKDIVVVDLLSTVLQFLHQVIIIVAVFLIFEIPVTLYAFVSLLGLALVVANGFWLTMAFGIIGARYRDLAQVMTAIMRIAFLATPIMWLPQGARGGFLGPFLFFNPFYHFLEIVRAPLLGNSVAVSTWVVVFAITVAGFALASWLYKRFGRLVPLWV
jgi:ABC-2 type transport system permease protein/lipopolysaccharide transport system permease protein